MTGDIKIYILFDMAFNEDSSASGHDEPWIQWFCGLKGHEMFCEVERSYIEDGFNLYGLRACVSNFSDCLDLILDRIGPDDSDDSHLTQSACTLYGLIHARYIITAHGLDAMYNKYAAKDFGTCPLVQCRLQNVLPVGLKDEMGSDTVKLFCPKCQQVYHAPPVRSRANSNGGVDGAAFGTTFPHLFLMTFSNLVPDPLPVEASYIPRVFGFRVNKSTRQHQRSTTPAIATEPAAQPVVAATSVGTSGTTPVVSNLPNMETESIAPNSNGDRVVGTYNSTKNEQKLDDAAGRGKEESDDGGDESRASSGRGHAATPLRGRSGAKEDGIPELSNNTSNNNGGSNLKRAGDAPTFLMENPTAKRRRRGGAST